MKVNVKIAVFGLLIVLVSSVRADVLIYTDTVNPPSSDPAVFDQFNIAQFNSSLGTLNSLSVTLSGLANASLAFTNTSPSTAYLQLTESNTLSVLYNNTQTIMSSNFVFQTPNDFSGLAGPVAANGGVYTNSWSYTLTSTVWSTSNPTDLANFTGATIIPLAAGFDDVFSFGATGGNNTWQVQTVGSLTATVTYSYTPVPEPTTSLLVGMGILAMGSIRRFRLLRKGS